MLTFSGDPIVYIVSFCLNKIEVFTIVFLKVFKCLVLVELDGRRAFPDDD